LENEKELFCSGIIKEWTVSVAPRHCNCHIVGDYYFKSPQRNGENEREHHVCCPQTHKIKALLAQL
jgi:hypothetical protein